jgi:glycosyltransferase involved in cell wall biosynthesis
MIICVVPRGLQGKGGIERLFAHIDRLGAIPGVRFVTSRGDKSFAWSLGVFALAIPHLAARAAFASRPIVHVNLSMYASAYRKSILSWIGRTLGGRVVVHFHGGGFELDAHKSMLWVRLNRRTIRKADAVIALGESWRDLFIDIGAAPERVHVIYNAVPDFAGDSIKERPAGGPVRILFAGEVGLRKGVDLLVDALGRLAKLPGWTCTIAGNGDVSGFRAAIEKAGVGDRVDFTGWIDTDAVHELMLQADIVVLPSRAEALPMSLIEGAAAGAALVASDAGATREIVDETCGLITPLDGEAIAHALESLITDPAWLQGLQAGARRRYLERFTVDRMISGLRRVYETVVADEIAKAPLKTKTMTSDE